LDLVQEAANPVEILVEALAVAPAVKQAVSRLHR
jgi:hypothetical protein